MKPAKPIEALDLIGLAIAEMNARGTGDSSLTEAWQNNLILYFLKTEHRTRQNKKGKNMKHQIIEQELTNRLIARCKSEIPPSPALAHPGRGFISIHYTADQGILSDTFNLRIGDECRDEAARRRLISAALELSRIHPDYIISKAAMIRSFVEQTKGNGVIWLNRKSRALPLP